MDKLFKNVDFMKNSNKYFAVSIFVILLGIIFIFINGINLDIEFTGGKAVEISINSDFTEQDINNIVKEITPEIPVIQKTGQDSKGVIVSFNNIEDEKLTEISNKIKEIYPESGQPSTKTVQPIYGNELKKSAIISVLAAVSLMIIYIAVRFTKIGGLSSGITASVGLLHNVLIMIAVYIIFKIPVNSAFIAAILTIIGYSINDTIIVYDRIRENRELYKKETLASLINMTIKQVLKRTVNTTVTSSATVAVLLGFAVYFGQQTLIQFTFPLLIGLLVGTYSSICIATPLWYKWQEKQSKK